MKRILILIHSIKKTATDYWMARSAINSKFNYAIKQLDNDKFISQYGLKFKQETSTELDSGKDKEASVPKAPQKYDRLIKRFQGRLISRYTLPPIPHQNEEVMIEKKKDRSHEI